MLNTTSLLKALRKGEGTSVHRLMAVLCLL